MDTFTLTITVLFGIACFFLGPELASQVLRSHKRSLYYLGAIAIALVTPICLVLFIPLMHDPDLLPVIWIPSSVATLAGIIVRSKVKDRQ